jgi:uncharacterized protein
MNSELLIFPQRQTPDQLIINRNDKDNVRAVQLYFSKDMLDMPQSIFYWSLRLIPTTEEWKLIM